MKQKTRYKNLFSIIKKKGFRTMKQSKTQLFLSLAKPDGRGHSRWVSVNEFVGAYQSLALGNGGSWCRGSSNLAKTYLIEFDKSLTKGNSIDKIRLCGFNTQKHFNQAIRKDIKEFYKNKNCVMLGINGTSENTKIEIDHKNGRKNEERISDVRHSKLKRFSAPL